MDLSERIEQLREAKNIRKADMAKALEMDASYYNKFEKRGNKLTVEQLEKMAGALGVSVLELLTGEPQTVQSDERVKELEKRIEELEELTVLLRDNLNFKEREFERLNGYFTNLIYNEIAKNSFERGYSKIRFYNINTGKKIVSGSKKEIIDLYKEVIVSQYMEWYRVTLPNQTDGNLRDIYSKRLLELENGNLDNLYIHSFIEVIAKHHNLQIWEVREDFAIIDKFKQKAVNLYFHNFIGEFGLGDKVEVIFESGVITDKILLGAYQKAKYFDNEGMEEGYDVNEDLELVLTGT